VGGVGGVVDVRLAAEEPHGIIEHCEAVRVAVGEGRFVGEKLPGGSRVSAVLAGAFVPEVGDLLFGKDPVVDGGLVDESVVVEGRVGAAAGPDP